MGETNIKIINVGIILVEFRQENMVHIMNIQQKDELVFLNSYISGWSKQQCIDKLKTKLQKANYTGTIKEVDNIYSEKNIESKGDC